MNQSPRPPLGDAPRIILKSGRDRSLLRRHPWVFSGAIARLEGDPQAGGAVIVAATDGTFLGSGTYSPISQIRVRIWSWDEATPINAQLIDQKIEAAVALRHRLMPNVTALRLLHGEADGLPGCVCDRYGDLLVLQLLSAGAARWRSAIIESLLAHTGAAQIYERSDADVLELEGLPHHTALLHGALPVLPGTVEEQGLRFTVDAINGHKTGFYLDQRDNRARVRACANVPEVLDCFCYTGAFTASALAGGAGHVTAIDSSHDALALAQHNLVQNGLAAEKVEFIEADVFKHLRKLRDQDRSYDVIILDPPKFAPTSATAERAARGYKDINLLAFKLLKPGGLLFTFSCSGGVNQDLFQKIVAGAALDAQVDARVVMHLNAGADHPIALNFPESEYLKGLCCAVV